MTEEQEKYFNDEEKNGIDVYRTKRVKEAKLLSDKPLRSCADALDVLGQTFALWDKEAVIILFLDEFYRPICIHVLSIGDERKCSTIKSEVMKAACLADACGLIYIHNHPTGEPRPSVGDARIHEMLKQQCKIMGFKYIDNVILSRKRFYSFSHNRYYDYQRDGSFVHYIGKVFKSKCIYPPMKRIR